MSSSSFTASFKELPESLRFALILAGAFMLFIVWDQWHWWNSREDYSFGFLVPMFVAYVIYDRWEKITGLVMGGTTLPAGGPAASSSAGRSLPGWMEMFLRAGAYAAVAGGVVLFLVGAFYRAGAGPSNPGSLFIALGFGTVLLPLIFLHAPAGFVGSTPPDNWWEALCQDRRLQVAGLFLFIAFIWIISAPLVSKVENNLNLFLLGKVTYVVFFVFDMGGFPLEQRGNVLVLPNGGEVGVAEACSGIRSLTACLFAGSFLGAVFLNRLWKKAALIGAAMCLAVFTNLLRSLFLTSWAYKYGSGAIAGFVHDAAGYAVLGLTCIGLIGLLPIFNLTLRVDEEGSADEEKTGKEEEPEETLTRR